MIVHQHTPVRTTRVPAPAGRLLVGWIAIGTLVGALLAAAPHATATPTSHLADGPATCCLNTGPGTGGH